MTICGDVKPDIFLERVQDEDGLRLGSGLKTQAQV